MKTKKEEDREKERERQILFWDAHNMLSVPTSIDRPVREDASWTVQIEDHSKLRFPWSVILSLTSNVCVYLSQQKRSISLSSRSTTSAEQNTATIRVKEVSYTQSTENAVLNGPRTGWLRKRLLELDGWENIFSNWTVQIKSSRTGRLMLVGPNLEKVITKKG